MAENQELQGEEGRWAARGPRLPGAALSPTGQDASPRRPLGAGLAPLT